jgi:hypothetical protein
MVIIFLINLNWYILGPICKLKNINLLHESKDQKFTDNILHSSSWSESWPGWYKILFCNNSTPEPNLTSRTTTLYSSFSKSMFSHAIPRSLPFWTIERLPFVISIFRYRIQPSYSLRPSLPHSYSLYFPLVILPPSQ